MSKSLAIMVHGLTGGENTWQNHDGTLFKDILLKNPKIAEDYDIKEFDYHTKLVTIKNSLAAKVIVNILNFTPYVNIKPPQRKKNSSILDLASELATYIEYETADYENILFITHSMGGLIVKKLILDELNNVYDFDSNISGYISLATPHQGSIGAAILGPINLNAKELGPLNKELSEINDEWIEQCSSLPPSIYIVAKGDECVSPVSAVPSSNKNKFKPNLVEEDHTTICKPDDNNSLTYKIVERFLLNRATESKLMSKSSIPYDPDIHSYDKEIFVVKLLLANIDKKLVEDAKESFFRTEQIIKSAPKKDRDRFAELKSRVVSIYKTYSSCSSGKTNSEIVKEIHEKIIELDKTSLECIVQYINFIHKKGFLHQAANNHDLNVTWDKATSLMDIQNKIGPTDD